MNIYIDFDRTMFNSDAFLSDLDNILDSYNLSPTLFYEYAKKDSENGFNPYHILEIMQKDIPFDKEIIRKLDEIIISDQKYLYDDVIPFLKYLKDKRYQLILLTKGNTFYQKLKIENTGILNYFDDLIITLKHKGELDIDYPNSIFIDDNPNEIASILKENPKLLIRIKRQNALYNNLDISDNITSFTSFQDILDKKLL